MASSSSRPMSSVAGDDRVARRGQETVAQRACLHAGGDAELAAQGAVESFELTQRGMPVASRVIAAHQLHVGLLVSGFERRPAPPTAR